MRLKYNKDVHWLLCSGLVPALLSILFSASGCGSGKPRYACVPFKRSAINPGVKLTGGLKINPQHQFGQVGSLGAIVYDRSTGRPMVLTNGHVVYGANVDDTPVPPFPKGRQMQIGGSSSFGSAERGNFTPSRFSSQPPDVAVINIDDYHFDYDNEVIGIGHIGGMAMPFVGQRVKMYNNQVPQNPKQNPIGVVYGVITPNGIQNVDPNYAFSASGNSGSVIVEDETGLNLVVALHYSGSGVTGLADLQSISSVLNFGTNPDTADARLYDPDKNPVAVFRYVDQLDGKHLLSTDWPELTMGGSFFNRRKEYEFRREGAVFRDSTQYQGVQMVPLVRFYNQGTDDSLYTTDPIEINNLEADDNWCNLGPTGWVPPVRMPGTIPLYRYFNANSDEHLYTTDANEVSGNSNYQMEGNYWVFEHDGEPDPSVYAGPPAAKIAVSPLCSSATIDVNGELGQSTLSGTVDLTIGPDCQGATCSLTIAGINLRSTDFNIGGQAVTQGNLTNYRYEVGSWQTDNTFVMPNLSTTITATFNIDGTPSAFTLINTTGPLSGTLNRDYSNFTLTGAFSDGKSSIRLSLCGQVVAHPPIAVLTPPGPFQCDSPQGAHVTFSSAQSSDPDNDITQRIWRVDNHTAGVDVVDLPTVLSLGSHPVSVTVHDSRRAYSTATETAIVIDSSGPQLTATVSPGCLWPKNHKFALFTLGNEIVANASDICDPAPKVRIVGVVSNQPTLGGGSGSTSVDYKFGSGAVCVRAESDGTQQTDREYTVTLEAADGSGNKTTRPFVISIPHDQGGGSKCKDRVVEFVDDNDPRCVQNAP